MDVIVKVNAVIPRLRPIMLCYFTMHTLLLSESASPCRTPVTGSNAPVVQVVKDLYEFTVQYVNSHRSSSEKSSIKFCLCHRHFFVSQQPGHDVALSYCSFPVWVWLLMLSFCSRPTCSAKVTKNSSGDEIANVNFLYDDIVHAVKIQ